MYSNKVLLDYADKFSSFNHVILFVDFFSFNEYGKLGKNHKNFYDVTKFSNNKKNVFLVLKKIDLWGYYYFSAGLIDAIKTVRINQEHSYNGFDLQPDGSFNYLGDATEYLWQGVIKSFLNNIWFPNNKFCFYDKSGISSNYQALENMLQDLYKKNIPVDIIISPIHFYTWSALYEAGLGPSFAEWKASLVKINEKVAQQQAKKVFPLWDFSPINEYSTSGLTDNWFYDPSHMSKKYGEMISQTIRDGNLSWQINSLNITDKLNKDKYLFSSAEEQYKNDQLNHWVKNYIKENKKNRSICDMNTLVDKEYVK